MKNREDFTRKTSRLYKEILLFNLEQEFSFTKMLSSRSIERQP